MVGHLEEMDDTGKRVRAPIVGNIVSQQAEQIAQMDALHDQQIAKLEEMASVGLLSGPNKEKNMLDMVTRQLEEMKLMEQEVSTFSVDWFFLSCAKKWRRCCLSIDDQCGT